MLYQNKDVKMISNNQMIHELKKQLDIDGGRIGFKKGMDRRTFMKMVGGLTAQGTYSW